MATWGRVADDQFGPSGMVDDARSVVQQEQLCPPATSSTTVADGDRGNAGAEKSERQVYTHSAMARQVHSRQRDGEAKCVHWLLGI
jgi:hypothetical protein